MTSYIQVKKYAFHQDKGAMYKKRHQGEDLGVLISVGLLLYCWNHKSKVDDMCRPDDSHHIAHSYDMPHEEHGDTK